MNRFILHLQHVPQLQGSTTENTLHSESVAFTSVGIPSLDQSVEVDSIEHYDRDGEHGVNAPARAELA